MFLIPKVRETFLTTHAQNSSLEVKAAGASPQSKRSAYPSAFSLESILAPRQADARGKTLRRTKPGLRTG